MASIEKEVKIDKVFYSLIHTVELINNCLPNSETYDTLFDRYLIKIKWLEKLGQDRETTKKLLREFNAVITNI